jgi:hypothetical protein
MFRILLLVPVLYSGWVIAQSTTSRGTFASPRTGVKWRYWIEDSSADLEVLHSDVTEMARVGSSGFQVLRSVLFV